MNDCFWPCSADRSAAHCYGTRTNEQPPRINGVEHPEAERVEGTLIERWVSRDPRGNRRARPLDEDEPASGQQHQ